MALSLPLLSTSVWAAAAQIQTITPACAAVGQSTSITGNGFGATNLRVTVGDVPASVTAATGNRATFVVPSGVVSGVVAVTATNPGGQSGSIALRIQGQGPEVCGNTVDENCNGQIDDPATCTFVNSPPVAQAGPDQTQLVGTTVLLDGTGSSDPDGDALSFTWSLASKPSGSVATLSGTTSTTPTFVIDKAGAYTIRLVVSDGTLSSSVAIVIVSTSNSAPVARAGDDRSGQVGNTLTLDGSGSTDVDGDPLTYHWTLLSWPSGSTAALVDATSVRPTLTLDKVGDYVVQLVVHDGTVSSEPDTMTISTLNSKPVADAGVDQSATVGTLVQLNGSNSFDVDGNALSYQWELTTTPAGSTATLSDPTSAQPRFTIDKPGTYAAQLMVNDGIASSEPDTVQVSTVNSKPVADAGADQTAEVGQPVQLDGRLSSDMDGDPLTYQWSLSTKPEGSTTSLIDEITAQPSFTPDLAGTYVGQIIVNDGTVDSEPDTALVTVTVPPDTTPPAPADLGKITVSTVENGQATVTGTAGSVEGNSQVRITNPRTGQIATVTANADGSFTAQVPAQARDQLALVVKDAAGNSSIVATVQVKLPVDPVDAPFVSVWNGMNAALLAGDKAAALSFLTTGAQAKYGPVFDALLPHMPKIIASYSPPLRMSVTADVGEYVVIRVINGKSHLFYIYFLKDENGVWQLDAM